MPTGKNEPTIERIRTALAATTRPNAKGRRDALDDISKAHVFVTDKPGQANWAWLVAGVLRLRVLFAFFSHVTSSLGLFAGFGKRPRRLVGAALPWLDAVSGTERRPA